MEMLKKRVWELLATIVGMNFKKEYEDALKLNIQISLRNLLFHAYNNVPYYHNVFRKVGVVKNGKLCLANFDKIPILTKEIIRRRASELISRDYKKRRWFYNSSGGSTGEPVNFIQDKLFSKWILVTSKYHYENILGLDGVFAKKILLWNTPRNSLGLSFGLKGTTISNALTNTIILDVLYMSETDMERYVRTINSYKPKIIRGYANTLNQICRFIEKRKMAVHTPTAVVSTAMVLRDDLRNKIEDVFGTKVYDFYGSREVDGIAGECKHGLLHIFAFNNYVEVLDNNKKAKEGENGKVIITALHNYSMPLVRFDIGDMAVLGPEKCECGNSLPTLKKITGRVCCVFRKEDGTIIDDEYFIELFFGKEQIKAFRIIQEDYKKIRIMIVPREGIIEDSERRSIEEKIRLVMGKDCKVTWEVVDEITKTNTGKYLYTQSLLSE